MNMTLFDDMSYCPDCFKKIKPYLDMLDIDNSFSTIKNTLQLFLGEKFLCEDCKENVERFFEYLPQLEIYLEKGAKFNKKYKADYYGDEGYIEVEEKNFDEDEFDEDVDELHDLKSNYVEPMFHCIVGNIEEFIGIHGFEMPEE